ncbi:ABCB25 [Symbiodinium sp. CCMP2456]|nr:ABCB25 [Symbiodinium sp. CCMP2456]
MQLSRPALSVATGAAFVVDVGVAFCIYYVGTHSKKDANVDEYESVTSDILTCCLVRIFVFPLMAGLAFLVYKRTEASSPLQQFRLAQESAREVVSNGTNGDLRVPLAEVPMQAVNGSAASSIVSTSSCEKSAFEMNRDHALLMKRADRRKEIIMLVLFAISTGMSFYNGIKCIVFHYDPRFLALQGTLQALTMVMINVEYFMLKNLLNKFTEEQGELIPHIHMHPLFFETGLKCHGCDVCGDQMKGPHYIAYRCRTCDFDLCPRCYKQKDKHSAKGFGARSVRRDGEQITTWTYFKRIVQLSMEFWPTLVAAVTCLVITQGLQIFAPNVQGSIFDGILAYLKNPEGGRSKFEYAMLTYVIINVLQGCFSGLKALAQELVQRRMACSVRLKLFASVVRMDISFFDTMHTGQLTSRLTNDAGQMTQPLSTLMNDLLANVLLLVGGMFMAFHTSWKLSILALTIVPPITYSYRAYAKWARKITRSIYCAYGEANSTATDAISNIRTVRGFSTEEHEAFRYSDSINTALGHGVRNAYVGASVTAFSTYLNLGTAVLILWYGGQLVCDEKGEVMSIGSLITFQLYWNMMNNAFIALGNVFNDLIRSSSAAERVFSLIDARPDVNPDDGEEVTRDCVKGHLQLRGIEFRYRSRPETLVLKGIDMDMPPGTTTALVGKSGGGKSTLVHLLMRFYEPTGGEIRLDGRSMSTLSSKSVRRCCGFVAQDTQLFSSTIVENLAYGIGRGYTRDEVVEACQAANAHEFILEMEEGYDTRVGEKGIMLSGGQKQRLAIARCFLRKPRMLFLDEATSALDAENEAIVQGALETLLSELNSTVVLIAHRLSTVINATQICVVHKGTIVERGCHDELVATGGVYAQLVSRQLSRDASAVMDSKKEKTKPSSKATEIDDLIEEMEQAGGKLGE